MCKNAKASVIHQHERHWRNARNAMCCLAKFFVSCNEKLENFASLQKGDIIMLEFLSDPSSPRLKTNHTSVFICVSGIAVWHMYYHSTATVRDDNVQPSLPLHDRCYFYLFCKWKVYAWLNGSNFYHHISSTRWRIPIATSFQYTRGIYKYVVYNYVQTSHKIIFN